MRSDTGPILAFDTSAAHCAAALLSGTQPPSVRIEEMARGQAERLMPMLEEMLAGAELRWSDLGILAVCTGPGNFTGCRIAVAAARGLAFGLGIPAIGLTLFEALAEPHAGPVLACHRDRKGSVFAQPWSGGTALGAVVSEAAALPALPVGTLCIGSGGEVLAGALGLTLGPNIAHADPVALARAAARRAGEPQPPPAPFYLRPADATPAFEPLPVLIDDA